MSFVQIKKEVKNALVANISSLQNVYGFEVVNASGFPYATVVRDGNENNYDTNAENMRIYAIRIGIFEQMGQLPPDASGSDNAKERAEGIVDEVVDEVIAYFDNRDNNRLGGILTQIEPVPSRGFYVQGQNGWLRGAEIVLKCHKHVNIT